jgi:hypothetical protein
VPANQRGVKHGDCKRHNGGFDSDLCTCGCAKVQDFLSAEERVKLVHGCLEVEKETDARALSHARAVIARVGT